MEEIQASKTLLDPITLTDEYLNDIRDTVRDVTAEVLQLLKQQHQQVFGAI